MNASARGWRPQSSSGARVTARPPEERVSRAAEAEQVLVEARRASGTENGPLSSAISAWTPPETRSSASVDTCSVGRVFISGWRRVPADSSVPCVKQESAVIK